MDRKVKLFWQTAFALLAYTGAWVWFGWQLAVVLFFLEWARNVRGS